MRNAIGQLICTEDYLVHTPYGLLITEVKKGELLSPNQIRFLENISYEFDRSKHLSMVTLAEKEFVEDIRFQGIEEIIKSLKMVHDFALYHTNLCLDTDEKNALYNLKILWDRLEEMAKS